TVALALLLTGGELQQRAQTPPATPPPALQTFDPNRIEDVIPRNNRRVPSATILYNVQSKKGDQFNLDLVRADVRRLYNLGYFDLITPYAEDGKTGVIVIFDVKEKPTIRSVEYKNAKSITRSEILEKLREKKVGIGQESAYDPTRVKRAEAVIKGMLAEKGHQNATIEVTTEQIPPNSINITFDINEGPKIKIEKIDIEGNKVFSDGKIKHSMKLIKQAGPLATLTGKDSYYDLKLADDVTRIRMLYDEHGYVRANVLDPDVVVKPS